MKAICNHLASPVFSDLDRHFAAFAEAQAGGARPTLALAAALVSRQRREGHVCLDLPTVAGSILRDTPDNEASGIRLPSLAAWLKDLAGSAVVGAPEEFRPLILDAAHRLYLQRYWHYEQHLAREILRRAGQAMEVADPAALEQRLDALFAPEPGGMVNWQRTAAEAAVRRNLCVISGGPGTGKTHSLVLILGLLLDLERARKLRIAVAAPTGKAAARIQDSIQAMRRQLPCSDDIKAQLPEQATTLHRLLGYRPDSASFRHNADNPLPYDVVAVDEASMVDLALMAKLFQAIPASARVILLGDKDQLASVEAGAVLGDIYAASRTPASGKPPAPAANKPLAACVVQLRRNYRFGEQSLIYQLSGAIKSGNADSALQILRRCEGKNAGDLAAAALPGRGQLKAALRDPIVSGLRAFMQARDPLAVLAALGQFRILCALREGPYGVAGLNSLTEDILEEEGLIRRNSPWYSRRPILITRNDYNLKLFNGDIGVILPDSQGEPRAFFPGSENTFRQFLPLRLPTHETAYALTVHKSQGSEFERVLMVLPDRDSPVLSRELLYTGLTRARKSVGLWFEESALRLSINRSVSRSSGLRDALAAQ